MTAANEKIPLGCAHYAVAYCLAAYGISMFAFDPGSAGYSFWMVLLAPLAFPVWLGMGCCLIGNSEVPTNVNALFTGLGIFLALFVIAVQIVRQSLLRPWVAYGTAAVLILYLVIVAFWFW